MSSDVTLRIRMPHRAGTLAKISAEIGRAGAVIGDLTTVHTDSIYSLRDVTIETAETELSGLIGAIEAAVPGTRVTVVPDRAVEFHQGGKLKVVPTKPVKSLADMRLAYTPA